MWRRASNAIHGLVGSAARARATAVLTVAASIGALAPAREVEADPRVPHGENLASRKDVGARATPPALLATLVQTHTEERVLLDAEAPPPARFDALLADRVTGAAHVVDPRLLGLVRALAAHYTGAGGAAPRIEIVSGFRTPKLNEMRRKKGHHVASHSQHSLGNALDFRIVPSGEARGVDPRALEAAIRAVGFRGGVGVYTLADDWFVHADVGPRRRWNG